MAVMLFSLISSSANILDWYDDSDGNCDGDDGGNGDGDGNCDGDGDYSSEYDEYIGEYYW